MNPRPPYDFESLRAAPYGAGKALFTFALVGAVCLLAGGCCVSVSIPPGAPEHMTLPFRSDAVDVTLRYDSEPKALGLENIFAQRFTIILEDAVFSRSIGTDRVVAFRAFGLTWTPDQLIKGLFGPDDTITHAEYEKLGRDAPASGATTRSVTTRPAVVGEVMMAYFQNDCGGIPGVEFYLCNIDKILCAFARSGDARAREMAKRWYVGIREKDRLDLVVAFFPSYIFTGSLVLDARARAKIDRAFGVN